jgi:ATP-dependent Clp protease protease subunit
MFRKPQIGDRNGAYSIDQYEYATSFLTREKRFLFLRGPIVPATIRSDSFSPTSVSDDIMALNVENDKDPITVFIDSPGGDVSTGFVLYDIIQMSKAPIITVAMNAISMGTVILTAGVERLAFKHSRIMLHLPSGDIEGDVQQIKIRSELFQELKHEIIDCYVARGVTAGLVDKTEKEIKKQILKDIDREKWFTADTALKYGLIDRIVTREDIFGVEKVERGNI